MYKNVGSQKVAVFAWNSLAETPETGDAANITAEISKDGGASAPTNNANPTELDAIDHPGVYLFDLTQSETNADLIVITPSSITANVVFDPLSLLIYTDSMDAIADGVWDEVLSSGTHDILFSAGQRLRHLVLRSGTAISGTGNSITLPGPWSATDGIYEDNIISIVDGLGAGQTRLIVDYVGADRKAYIDKDWDVIPDNTSVIELLPFASLILLEHGLAQAGGNTSITLAATALPSDDSYVGSLALITTGTGQGQVRLITAYNGTTKVATVSPAWEINPDNTSIYKVVPVGRTIVDTFGTDAKAEMNTEMDTALSDTGIEAVLKGSSFRKNVALTNFSFVMKDAGDHVTPTTGLTVTGQISKDGGAFAALTNAVTEIGSGCYKVDLIQAEMNANSIILRFTAAGADPTLIFIHTID